MRAHGHVTTVFKPRAPHAFFLDVLTTAATDSPMHCMSLATSKVVVQGLICVVSRRDQAREHARVFCAHVPWLATRRLNVLAR